MLRSMSVKSAPALGNLKKEDNKGYELSEQSDPNSDGLPNVNKRDQPGRDSKQSILSEM